MRLFARSGLAVLWWGIAANLAFADSEGANNRFQFRLPHAAAYRIDESQTRSRSASAKVEWLKAWPEGAATNFVELGDRVVLQLNSAGDLERLTTGHALQLSRTVASNVFILQAPDAVTAAREAHRLAALAEVLASYPVLRKQAELHGPYAPQPTETFFSQENGGWLINSWEWWLENRNSDGSRAGVDLNVRAAWPYTLGQGATIAVADVGVDFTHPALAGHHCGPDYNFFLQSTNGANISCAGWGAHGTEVAGLAVASVPNALRVVTNLVLGSPCVVTNARMLGVAPGACLASWVIFTNNNVLVDDERLMEMYQYQSNLVSVQIHSWGHPGQGQNPPTLLEQIGISNAITYGRSGRGVVIVRSVGNDRYRASFYNADDDGYPSDPRVIAVAAVRKDGRVCSYSKPGACVLLGAPSSDEDAGFNTLLTTDLVGTCGVNQINYFCPFADLNNYGWGAYGFSGTSAAVPQIAGVAALMLSANPNLTYRDVQQILILSSRHFDFADPDLVTNGAGFPVSHNLGFGVPDAGLAVNLARSWINRPPLTQVTLTATNPAAIPDDGLRLLITGSGVPANLVSVHTLPGVGPHADTPTAEVPLVDFGYGTNCLPGSLTNKAALIQRQGASDSYAPQINLAAQCGAAFVVFYNSTNPVTVPPLADTAFVPIVAVFVGHTDGEALKSLIQTNSSALAQIHLNSTNYVFTVTNTLICEHVGLYVTTDHPLRGDVRITLVSPAGTRSVLQARNNDTDPGPTSWTYYSTHHFFESSAGNWTASFSDEGAGFTGAVREVGLTIYGVPIRDRDRDGLDDFWEITYFDCLLAQGAEDDPDRDGYSNAWEQIMGTDPTVPNNLPFTLDLSRWNRSLARLSWPGSPWFTYEVWGGTNVNALSLITTVPGRFPETEWFAPYNTLSRQFFRVRAIPVP
jgi:subtilisin-like proprotein convertase family protein/subtilisin family serine protease